MKIAFFLGEFPSISQTFILNQITGILDAEHSIKIFVNKNTKDKKIHPDIKKYNLMDHTFYFNPPQNKIYRILKAIPLFFSNFHKNPRKILKSINIFKYGKEALCLRLFYATIVFLDDDFNYDLIHCHFGSLGILGVCLRDIGVVKGKILTSFHGHDVYSYVNINGKDVYKRLFREGELFTANTNYTKKQMMNLGCDENKITILPEGLKIEKFKFYERKIKNKEPITVLTIARLCETKGHRYTIKAISEIVKKYKNIEYIIAGDGPLKEELVGLVNRLELNDYVKFLGEVEENEALELLKKAHIFIHPSVTASNGDKEGQALAIQEAQATGLPIISTLHNGIPEGVLDGKSGFLVPEKDSNALAEKIEYFIKNPELLSKMGKTGRDFVKGKYDIKILSKKLINLYQNLINNKK